MSTPAEKTKPVLDTSIANPANVAKFRDAGAITTKVMAAVRAKVVAGAAINDICVFGDDLMVEELLKVYTSKKSKIKKGIAFPTCVNPNQIPAHLAPSSAEDKANLVLADGDVVNVMLGVQIAGYPAIVAETVVVGEENGAITGRKADLVHSGWTASEAAIRTFQPGNKNWDVTNIVDKVCKSYGTVAVQSMLTHNIEKDVLYGPKEVILNPSKEAKKQVDTVRFANNEVYGLDILVSTSADGKVQLSPYVTTLFKPTGNSYSLRLNASKVAMKELTEKSKGPFPFHVRNFSDPKRGRVGMSEPSKHNVVLPYEVMTAKNGEFVAQYFTTFAITEKGIEVFAQPTFNADLYKTEKTPEADIAELIKTPLASEN